MKSQTFIVPKIVMVNIQKSRLLVGVLCTKLFNRRDCLKTARYYGYNINLMKLDIVVNGNTLTVLTNDSFLATVFEINCQKKQNI